MDTNRRLGLLSAIGVICIWSGFIVFSRLGVTSELTAFDMTGLRFVVAGGLTLPFVLAWWPRHLPLRVQVLLCVTGPGVLYSLLIFFGLQDASAAYAGVFGNGFLPIFTVALVAMFAGTRPSGRQVFGIALILGGAALVSLSDGAAVGGNLWRGVALFLAASAVLSVYIFGLQHWALSPRQALALVNIPNAVVFIPIWLLALPSGVADVGLGTIVFHALFQGLGPGFLAVILFALAARHLGSTATAGFSAAVPASAALLAIPILAEVPSPVQWLGILVVSLGLWLLLRR